MKAIFLVTNPGIFDRRLVHRRGFRVIGSIQIHIYILYFIKNGMGKIVLLYKY